jgi:N-acetylglucosaminyldiphosphoundecaprenol N-acetyl-beta-D-mannosaminyltransferase
MSSHSAPAPRPPSSSAPSDLDSASVLGLSVHRIEFAPAAELIHSWCVKGGSRVVCAANVHMVMEAWDDHSFRAQVNRADLVVPDGQPMVWALRLLGQPQRRRVRVSPDFLLRLFELGSESGTILGLYGGQEQTLLTFTASLGAAYPEVKVGFAYAPPFRPLSRDEDLAVTDEIKTAAVQLLLVGIGCPKQERWMADHREKLDCVMIGVGAAFDLFGGRTTEAPRWMRNVGLEWTYRLALEPRRLWRRYLKQNPRFVAWFAVQLVGRVIGLFQR